MTLFQTEILGSGTPKGSSFYWSEMSAISLSHSHLFVRRQLTFQTTHKLLDGLTVFIQPLGFSLAKQNSALSTATWKYCGSGKLPVSFTNLNMLFQFLFFFFVCVCVFSVMITVTPWLPSYFIISNILYLIYLCSSDIRPVLPLSVLYHCVFCR